MTNYASQIGQDAFVVEQLKGKRDGTFLDVGCSHWRIINNTYHLEESLGWRGVAIDCVGSYQSGWEENRRNSQFVLADATQLDYTALCDLFQMPGVIDYLSVDLEPPNLSLLALEAVMRSDRRFRVITFETDFYRQQATRYPSRKLLSSLGYRLVKFDRQDDFWVSGENI